MLSQEILIKLYRPHPKQAEIALNNKRFKVMVAGRRFGKTTLVINELIFHAFNRVGDYWYIAPTYRQAKTIAWRMLLQIYYSLPKALRKQKNEAELWIELCNNSRIELKGADNEDSLRGSGLSGLVIDEVASIRNFNILWQEVLRPSLTDKKGWCWFIGTPKGFNHFYELFEKGQKGGDWQSWRFTSYDNPYLPISEIEQARQELTEDAFSQEYLGDFRKFTGLVYKEFDRKIHVIEPIDLPSFWRFYRCMDFGAVNPTVCLWLALDNSDNWYVFREYYNSGQTAQFHANVINAMTKENVIATFGDPSGQQEILDYGIAGLPIAAATKVYKEGENWVNSGIEKVRELLYIHPQTKRPRLYIFKDCINLIREMESYHWLENKQGRLIKDQVEKIDDHCCFTKDTLIEIPYGSIIHQKSTGIKDIYSFMGSKVTKDHPYLTPRGFVNLDALRYNDYICKAKSLLWMELPLDDTQVPRGMTVRSILHLLLRNLQAIKLNVFTGIYGKNIMVKYPKAFISIIKTIMLLIIIYLISNVYHLGNIIINIMKAIYLAKKNIYPKQNLENSATIIAKLKHLGKEEVFATTTTSGIFLANGVIVTNCDALRYGIVSIPEQHFQQYEPEVEISKNKFTGY